MADKKCKSEFCPHTGDKELTLEASGYCFTCAEELACLLADEGMSSDSAWR